MSKISTVYRRHTITLELKDKLLYIGKTLQTVFQL
jgi:hypothetical protein